MNEKEGPVDRVLTEIPARNRKSHFSSKVTLERSLRPGGHAETLLRQRGGVYIKDQDKKPFKREWKGKENLDDETR
jgi:hypothetical protein